MERVLVVDDDAGVAAVVAEVLSGVGYQVATAGDGVAALDALAHGEYAVIVSDVRMPRLDGPGLVREVERRWPALARRVVFITGDTLDLDTRRFIDGIGAPVLRKPFDFARLRGLVQEVLQR